jgi:acylphosphatase
VQVQAHIIVSGMVQGIGYRFFVFRHARSLRLDGWVKNLPSGEVEICAEGQRGLIETFIQGLWTGNPYATVRNVDVAWNAFSGQFTGFNIVH